MQQTYLCKVTKLKMIAICLIILFSFLSSLSSVTLNVKANVGDKRVGSPRFNTQDSLTGQSSSVTSSKLELGKAFERDLKADQSHSYTIEIKANSYLNLVVEQKGIDVVVRLFSPSGEKLQEVDSPNGDEGEEPLEVILEKEGNYRLEVLSLDKNAAAAKYVVLIKELRVANDRDKDVVEANKLASDGEMLKQDNKFDLALPMFIKALELRKKVLGGEHFLTAKSTNDLGVLYRNKAEYEKSEPLLVQALEIRKKILGENHLDTAQSMSELALLYRRKAEYQKSESFYLGALEIYKKVLGENHLDTSTLMNDLALLYKDEGNYEKTESLLVQVLEIRKKVLGENHPFTALSMNNLGLLYVDKGDYRKAETLYIQALEINRKVSGENDLNTVLFMNNLGILYRNKGDYEKAEPLLSRVLEIRKKVLGENHTFTAFSMAILGILYRDKGEYEKAEPLLIQALEIRRKALGENHPATALSMGVLGLLYRDKGEYIKAEPLLIQALEVRKKALGENHPEVIASINNLALLYKDKGEYERAEPLYIQALEIRKKVLGENHPETTVSMNSLGQFYKETGKYGKAEPLLVQALEIRKKVLGENHRETAQSMTNLALIYREKGEYEKAEPLFNQAVKIYIKALGENHPDTAQSISNLGVFYKEKGEYEKAEPFYNQAIKIQSNALGKNHPNTTEFTNKLGVFYAAKGEYGKALEISKQVNEAREAELVINLSIGSEKSKQSYLQKYAIETDQTLSLHIQNLPKNTTASQLALTQILRRKGRALDAVNQSIEALRKRSKPEDIALLDELAQKKTLLSKLLTQGVGNLTAEEYQGQIKDLQDKVEKLENKVSQISAEFRTQSQAITLEAVQTAIPQNATLIEFATYQPYDFKTDNRSTPRYVVYMLNNSGKIEWVELGETSDIDKLVEDFRQTLIKRPGGLLSDIEQELKPKARALDKAIMQPVRKLLGKNKRLLIAPDGNLNLIPFDALVDEQGKYLVEHYEVSYLTSGRDLLRLQNGIKSEQKPLVMADPNYGEGEGTKIGELVVAGNRLKYTALEANEIKQILNLQPSELLLQDQATKFALKQIHRPEILHIATHGFFLKEQEGSDDSRRTKVKRVGLQPEPEVKQVAVDAFKLSPLLKSGLLLAGANKGDSDNGVLTALDATSLDLWGTKLVVLSACDTAVGEVKNGDGVYGLRRALVLAGSESQLMSLWQVSDVGTRDLMTQYYQALKNNEGRSAGLRKVRLKLLKSAKRHHPYYWASFIQSGEWANLNGKR